VSETIIKLAWGFGEGIQPQNLDYWTLRANQLRVDKVQLALDTAKNNLDTSKDNLDKAKISLDITRDDLDRADDELEKVVNIIPGRS
jgi:hypothetical protein